PIAGDDRRRENAAPGLEHPRPVAAVASGNGARAGVARVVAHLGPGRGRIQRHGRSGRPCSLNATADPCRYAEEARAERRCAADTAACQSGTRSAVVSPTRLPPTIRTFTCSSGGCLAAVVMYEPLGLAYP